MPSVIEVEEVGRTYSRPIDDVAKAVFLATLRERGIYSEAAMAARQHLQNKGSAVSAFRQLESRDPEFAARVEEAYAEVAAKGEAEVHRRAFEGVVEKVKYAQRESGELIRDENGDPVVAEETTKYDNNLLLLVTRNALRRIDPEAYSPPTAKKQVTVTGGTTNLTATVDLDRLLERVPRDAREAILKAAQEMKELPPGKDPIDV